MCQSFGSNLNIFDTGSLPYVLGLRKLRQRQLFVQDAHRDDAGTSALADTSVSLISVLYAFHMSYSEAVLAATGTEDLGLYAVCLAFLN